jgi:hypothetical protein
MKFNKLPNSILNHLRSRFLDNESELDQYKGSQPEGGEFHYEYAIVSEALTNIEEALIKEAYTTWKQSLDKDIETQIKNLRKLLGICWNVYQRTGDHPYGMSAVDCLEELIDELIDGPLVDQANSILSNMKG